MYLRSVQWECAEHLSRQTRSHCFIWFHPFKRTTFNYHHNYQFENGIFQNTQPLSSSHCAQNDALQFLHRTCLLPRSSPFTSPAHPLWCLFTFQMQKKTTTNIIQIQPSNGTKGKEKKRRNRRERPPHTCIVAAHYPGNQRISKSVP